MSKHSGGKIGKAAKTLASKTSSKSAKSRAGTTLANHKQQNHKQLVYNREIHIEFPGYMFYWFVILYY